MQLTTQPYKGTRDFYPEDFRIQEWMFSKMRRTALRFGFEEYDGPMLEPFELYAAKTGEEIINNQLYWLVDRGERKLAVRPEMTPTLARMVAGKIHELPRPVRWFSIPNLWRYERPQRGRLREHWQLNADILGGDTALADSELLHFALELMDAYGGLSHVKIHINHRKLVDLFFSKKLGLSTDQAHQAGKAIDSRAKVGEERYAAWLSEIGINSTQQKQMEEFFSTDLKGVTRLLQDLPDHSAPGSGLYELQQLTSRVSETFGTAANSVLTFDPKIFRGLDYYTGTVFEMYDTSPENPRAMFGGGRYDNLVGLFGKHTLSGVGLGLGDVTLRNFLETHALLPKIERHIDLFIALPDLKFRPHAEALARSARHAGFHVVTPLEVGGFSQQLKLASKMGARYAVLYGEAEWAEGNVILKDLTAQTQATVPQDQVLKHTTSPTHATKGVNT